MSDNKPKNTGPGFAILKMFAGVTRQHDARGFTRWLRVLYTQLLLRFYHMNRRGKSYFDVVMEYEPNLLINTSSADFVQWYLFFFGNYQVGIPFLLRRLVKPGFVCIDIGANVGAYSLLMAQLAGPQGQIIAFEPHPTNRRRLRENFSLNRLTNIQVKPYAISNKSGEFALHVPADDSGVTATSSLHVESVRHHIEAEIMVEVHTLDDLIGKADLDHLDLIKTDTEGHDYEVILGAQETIRRYKPHVLFEFDRSTWVDSDRKLAELQEFFSGLSYLLYVIHHGVIVRLTRLEYGFHEAVGGDILAVPLLDDGK